MEVSEALVTRRTIRKFNQNSIAKRKLTTLINYARLAPFAGNIQALKYSIVNDPETCDKIFPNLKWAGYLSNGAPEKEFRPTAYIAVLGDTSIKDSFETDAGSAILSILLGAHDMGLGACWLGSINRTQIKNILKIPEQYSLLYVIALGYPAEKSRTCSPKKGFKYFYDICRILNVPKRDLKDIII